MTISRLVFISDFIKTDDLRFIAKFFRVFKKQFNAQ